MPKQVKWTSNQGVDVGDLTYGTVTYPGSVMKHFIERVGIDNLSRIIDGFKIEITLPRTITVHNGVAWNRDGQIVNAEDLYNDSSQVTLSLNNTHYVEIEFALDESDTDYRAFWDSTYDNGNDTSGDALPPGREFKENVATRYTPKWSVVTNTSGFATTPETVSGYNSLRIPLAIIKVDGTEIISGGVQVVPVVPVAVLKKDAQIGTKKLWCFNIREFPDVVPFDINIYLSENGATTLSRTVDEIDKENGYLHITSGTVDDIYVAGSRVELDETTPKYLTERTTPEFSGTDTIDARLRYFQGDDDKGYALSQDPFNNPGRSDTLVVSEKNYKDFIASQIREMKFGGLKGTKVGNVNPPDSFATQPRYFHQSPSITGAKTNTVSVGDGVFTFGDFNTTTSGSAYAAIKAAIDFIDSFGGGTLYIKSGTYNIVNTSLVINSPTTIIGDGGEYGSISGTRIIATGNTKALSVNSTVNISNVQFDIDSGATATASVLFDSGSGGKVDNCTFYGADVRAGGAHYLTFNNCFFVDKNATTTKIALLLSANYTTFNNCQFEAHFSNAGSRTVKITGTPLYNYFNNCVFYDVADADYVIEISGQPTQLLLDGCIILGTAPTTYGIVSSAASNNISILNTYCEAAMGLFKADGATCDNLTIKNCKISVAGTTVAKKLVQIDNSVASKNIVIDGLRVVQTAKNTGMLYPVDLGQSEGALLTNSQFMDCDSMFTISGAANNITVSKCLSKRGDVSQSVKEFFSISGGVNKMTVSDCIFDGLYHQAADIYGVLLDGQVADLKLSDCVFSDIPGTSQTNVNGLYFKDTGIFESVWVDSCRFTGISGTSTCYVVNYTNEATNSTGDVRLTNNTFEYIGSAGAAPTVIGGYITRAKRLVFDNNKMLFLGNNDSTTVKGLSVFTDTGQSFEIENLSVCNNVFNGVTSDAAATVYMIEVDRGCRSGSINNNNFVPNNINAVCVFVHRSGGTYHIKDLNINNNTLSGTDVTGGGAYLKSGIIVQDLIAEEALPNGMWDGNIGISGNTIKDFDESGVLVSGTNTTEAHAINVTNNTIFNNIEPTTTSDGIRVFECQDVNVTGNTLRMLNATTGTTSNGICVDSCDNQNISVNHVRMNRPNASFWGIIASGTNANISGNFVHTGGVAGNTSVQGISTNSCTRAFLSGNFIIGVAAAHGVPADTGIKASGTTLQDAMPDASVSPTPTGDTNLNYRKAAV
jgi:hypothetical protein